MMMNIHDYDEIWVPSDFIADSIRQSSGYDGTLLRVLPYPLVLDLNATVDYVVEKNHSLQRGLAAFGLEDNGAFVFLVVFDFWSVEERKFPEGAIKAFPNTDASNQRYWLIVKSQHGGPDQLMRLSSLAGDDARIHFVLSAYGVTAIGVKMRQYLLESFPFIEKKVNFALSNDDDDSPLEIDQSNPVIVFPWLEIP